ncbi:MAG: hypothetical protein AB1499_07015 [Nitrospirota bacterium]
MIKTAAIVITSIIAVLLIYLFPKQTINPGDLIEGHQELENNCMKCHTVFLGTPGEKCVVCHKPADIGRITTAGVPIETISGRQKAAFHHLFSADTCLTCHPDHKGRDAAKTDRRFSHELLKGVDMKKCSTCHKGPDDNIHQKNRQECSQCHTDEKWRPAIFDHARYFRFDKEHGADCASCHPNNNYREYTCYGCHEHSPEKIRQEHEKVKIYSYQHCTICHLSGDKEETKGLLQSIKDRHASANTIKSGASLQPGSNSPAYNESLKGISISNCISCHRSPFDKLHQAGNRNCSECHSTDRWRPAAVDHARYFRFDKDHLVPCATCHTNNNYKEYTCYGCHEHSPDKIRQDHEKVKIYSYQNCTLCHLSGDKEETKGILQSIKDRHATGNNITGGAYLETDNRRHGGAGAFRGRSISDCVSCHRGPFDNMHGTATLDCSQCHTTDRWRPASLDHTRFFRFDGNHRADCLICHQDYNYREYTCYGCHEHSPGKIRKEHLEEGIGNYQDCAACHPSGNEHDIRRVREPRDLNNGFSGEYRGNEVPYRTPEYRSDRYGDGQRSHGRKHKEEDDDDDD